MMDSDDRGKTGADDAGNGGGAPPEAAAAEPAGEAAREATEATAEAAEAAEPSPEEQIAALKDQLLRALAEAENVRRRGQRELEDARRFAVADFARDVLSLADNLDRALDSARQAGIGGGPLVEGVELTQRQFLQILQKFGIRPIEAAGQKLDPNLHQAMLQVENAEAEPGTVVQVMQTGYLIHDRLLRPAMVVVAKPPAPEPPPDAG